MTVHPPRRAVEGPAEPKRVAGHTFDRANLPLLLTLGLGVFAGALDLGVLSPRCPRSRAVSRSHRATWLPPSRR